MKFVDVLIIKPSVCLITLVYCGQTVGWIKMPLGTEVGFGPGDIVLDGDPAPHGKGHSSPRTFWPMSIVANGSMNQDATWYGGRHRPRRHCVRWGPSSLRRRGTTAPLTFRPTLFWHGGPSQQLLSSCYQQHCEQRKAQVFNLLRCLF